MLIERADPIRRFTNTTDGSNHLKRVVVITRNELLKEIESRKATEQLRNRTSDAKQN